MVAVFGPNYLRAPNVDDTTRILVQNAARGFSRLLGNIDCMHWVVTIVHFLRKGYTKGHTGECSIILGAVPDYELWIGTLFLAWHH
jgi:hypothetical protein